MPTEYLHALIGGLAIGIAASGMLLGHGKILGVSGIFRGVLFRQGRAAWRLSFLGGALVGGAIALYLRPDLFVNEYSSDPLRLAVAGLLVGFGTSMGNGCTSGHGVCGMGRLSPRSILATLTFIAAGALTVVVLR